MRFLLGSAAVALQETFTAVGLSDRADHLVAYL